MRRKEYQAGCIVEMEHTKSRRAACKIARDHLREDSRYYTKLCRIWPREKGCSALGAGRVPKKWWDRPAPRRQRLCYQTKTNALNAFLDTNWRIVENYGGQNYRAGVSEFDAVNHKYGTKVRTIAEATWAAMPSGRPFCLDMIDVDALNDTSPAREAGENFRLPDFVQEKKAAAEEERYYREQM